MNLYLITQEVNEQYDTYDSAVVVAESEHAARNMHPGAYSAFWKLETWTEPENVKVALLGTAVDPTPRVVCASFNAG